MTILIIVLAIALQVFLSVKKISPFLSLLIVAIATGLCLGMPAADLLKSIEKGVGSTLGGLALILCLGAILGKILEESGAAEKITITLINGFGLKKIQWAVMLTGFLIGIPLYYNAGFVILVPLVFMLVRKTGLPLLYVAIPMAAALSTTHCFLPPHPGPVVLVNAFGADMGKVLVYGIIIAIPAVIVAGPILGRFLKGIRSAELIVVAPAPATVALPKAFPSFMIALLPVLLITLAVVCNAFLDQGHLLRQFFSFVGEPVIALFVSVILAIYYFGIRAGIQMDNIMKWVSDAIAGIAMILLIITAGGVFKQVLQDSGHALHFGVQVAVGVNFFLIGFSRDKNQGRLVAPGRQMAVHGVVAQVGHPPHKPLGKRRVAVVTNLFWRHFPVHQLGLLSPKSVTVVDGTCVKFSVAAHESLLKIVF